MDISDIFVIAFHIRNVPNHVINFILDEINGLLIPVHTLNLLKRVVSLRKMINNNGDITITIPEL